MDLKNDFETSIIRSFYPYILASLTAADGKGLYPIFAIASHYCICNARYTLDPKTKNMYLRARSLIRLGTVQNFQKGITSSLSIRKNW